MKAIALSVFLAVLYTWLGIFFAVNGTIPVSFYIAAIAFIVYFPVRLLTERGKG
jgi:ABC-type Mn2+/Zn2+ transport system permease subunit